MPDDETTHGAAERVARLEEVQDLAKKHNLTDKEARELIERHGNDREKLEAEAETLDRGQGP